MARRKNTTRDQDTTPTPKFSKSTAKKALRIFTYIRPYRYYFGLGMVLLFVSSLVFMIFPAASGEILNVATGKGEYGLTLDQIALGLLMILLVQSGVSFVRVWLFTKVSEYAMADVRTDLYERMISLPLSFFEENRVGDLSSRIANDVQQLQETLSLTSAEFIRQLIVLTVGISYLLYKTPDLSLLMFATFPAIVILALLFGRQIRKLSRQRQDEFGTTHTLLEETLQSIQVVKTFTNEAYEGQRYKNANIKVVKLAMRLGVFRALFVSFIIAILFGVIFFVLWQGALMVQDGTMTAGDLVTFIALTAIIGGSMGGLADIYTQLLKAMGSAERVFDILDLESEVNPHEIPKNSSKAKIKGHIRFDKVSFSYPSRPDIVVLKELSLDIPPGRKVALVGASGAGKSTVVQLLLQLYQPQSGTILLDGQPVTAHSLHAYRTHFAIVPQEVMLFGGTIKENIRYGRTDATDQEVAEAAREANCLEFIEGFPEGMETMVGERGIKLSGGQRQRIAIARAVLRDPAILLLDEATSSLDAESEKVVQEALDRLMRNRTSLIIAHRLATIRSADTIYVLDHGTLIEEGTHDQLVEKEDGHYQKLAKLQFQALPTDDDND
jgi:ATP-binding cassette, subfamily B, bacterial